MTATVRARSASRIPVLCSALLASTCISGTAFAGDVSGTVTSSSLDRPVRGAVVTVEQSGQSVATDAQGRYILRNLDAGTYSVRIEQPGYSSQSITVDVPAEGMVTADGRLALDLGESVEEIVITGGRASRLLAIERKRAMQVIADVVSSDGIGKLPDYNTAEALQRLPGVSVEIDQSEPRYVVIRGVDPNLNLVTIDGNVVGIPEAEGRRVALDTIPSDLVAAIEVVKTATPDYDANAIGGAINIVTPSAYDQSEPFTYVSARGIYASKAEKMGFGGSVMHGQTFGYDDAFGLVIGFSYSKRFIDSDLVDPLSWEEVDSGFWAPTGMRMFDYSIMRERIGGIANMEWRPNDDVRVYLNTIYNEFTDHEGRDQFDYDMFRGDVLFPEANQVTYDRGRASREFRQNEQTQKLYNISPGVDWRFDTYELKLNYTYSHAQEHTPIRDDIEFRTGSSNVSTILVGDGMPTFVSADPALYDPAEYPLRRIRLRRETIDEDLHAFKADLQADFADGTDSFIKVGAKFTDRSKDRDNYQEQWTPVNDVTFADTGAVLGNPSNFFSDRYAFGPGMDYYGILDYFFTQNPGSLELDEETTAFNDKASDYTINEKIYAGYAMVSVDMDDVTVIAGARVEHTAGEYNAFAIRDTDGNGDIEISDIVPLNLDKDYTHVLPSISVTYRPQPELVFRAAWTNMIGRPNYSDVVPTFEEEDGEGASGNPNLKPYKSMAFDLSAEYYPNADTVYALAAFYKHIKNPIYTQTIYNTTFAGVDLISLSQPQNADSGELLGLEANVTTRFSTLPSPFDGLGVSANVTYVDSSVDVPGRLADDLPFFRQSKWLASGALFYEKGPVEARLAVSYRDSYLGGVGASTDFDGYTKGRTVLDARVGYRVMEGIEVFASVSNFTEASEINYQGNASRINAHEAYGVNADFGISAKF